jgi:hypothetical protein
MRKRVARATFTQDATDGGNRTLGRGFWLPPSFCALEDPLKTQKPVRRTKMVMVLLGPEQIDRLDTLAQRRLLSRSAIIREACEEMLSRTDANTNVPVQGGQTA